MNVTTEITKLSIIALQEMRDAKDYLEQITNGELTEVDAKFTHKIIQHVRSANAAVAHIHSRTCGEPIPKVGK